MAMAAGPSRGHKSDINVTPLVDVCLVLLIIFMVVTPMLQRGKDVTLPEVAKKAKQHEEKNPEDPLILSVTKDKKIWVEKDQFDETSLKDKLVHVLGATPGKPILLKGDQALTYGDVRKVMLVAQHAGAKGIKLGVQEEGKKGE